MGMRIRGGKESANAEWSKAIQELHPAPPDEPRFTKVDTIKFTAWSGGGVQVLQDVTLCHHHPHVAALLYDMETKPTNVVVTYPDGQTILYERN